MREKPRVDKQGVSMRILIQENKKKFSSETLWIHEFLSYYEICLKYQRPESKSEFRISSMFKLNKAGYIPQAECNI